MNFTRDYILRQVEQLQRAIAAILRHRDEQRMAESLDTLGDTYVDLLGHRAEALSHLTPESAAMTLGKWPRIRIYATLLSVEAEVLASRADAGDAERAARLRLRALQLTLLGLARGGRGDPALKDVASELLPQVDPDELDSRSLAALRELGLIR